ncbi:MAG: hypothetical protein HY904_21970 [Deltaproteobacteria bacterium]|nr:hypothetical protein [Deltaproteobacteria bacterium]
MFWVLVCMTAAGAFGMGLALAQLRTVPGTAGALPGRRSGTGSPAPGPDDAEGDVFGQLLSLRPGDVVLHLEEELVTEQVTRLAVEGRTLLVARLLAPAGGAVVVSEDPGPLATYCLVVADAGLAWPPPEQFVLEGLVWRRQRRVEARPPGGASWTVHLFEGPDGHYLWTLQRGTEFEVLRGTELSPSAVSVLRGPGE